MEVLQNGHFLQENESPLCAINPRITSAPDSSPINLGKAGALVLVPPLCFDVLTSNLGKHRFITAFTTHARHYSYKLWLEKRWCVKFSLEIP